jgi:hypothetical protein
MNDPGTGSEGSGNPWPAPGVGGTLRPRRTTVEHSDSTRDAIIRIFQDPSAAWTLDELARRFQLSIGEAVRVMSDLEAIDVVRRIDDEYVPSRSLAV